MNLIALLLSLSLINALPNDSNIEKSGSNLNILSKSNHSFKRPSKNVVTSGKYNPKPSKNVLTSGKYGPKRPSKISGKYNPKRPSKKSGKYSPKRPSKKLENTFPNFHQKM